MNDYSPAAQEALNKAASVAHKYNHSYIGTEHIFAAILAQPEAEACLRFEKLGLDPDQLVLELEQMIGRGEPVLQEGSLPVTARTRKVLELAKIEARRLGSDTVGTQHIIIAILREGESVAAQVLLNHNLTVEKFLGAKGRAAESAQPEAGGDEEVPSLDELAHPEESDGEPSESTRTEGENGKQQKTPAINAYGRDLTEMAKKKELDPVVGRRSELERIVQVLCRRTKNNAVLIGEAGVGKTAVVEGLAQAIASGEVPDRMRGKRVVAIDMARIVAGTMYRGQFEERLKKIIEETKRVKNVILFLDEIHTLVGAGGAEGTMDAANILKPALARGELQVVGATTLKEYHKSIEKDAALERRFQSILVNEPSADDAVQILQGIAPCYEQHHNVTYTPEALRAAVTLTARYLPARLLPDKAIDAIDETGARVRMKSASRPPDLKWEQDEIARIHALKDEAIAAENYDDAAKYRSEELEAKKVLADKLEAWKAEHAEKKIVVDADAIAETVASISGVPVERMSQTTSGKFLNIERDLNNVVIGQESAITAVAHALRRSRAALGDPKRPIGSFLFLGPTGVGKTLLAKMLAEKIYGDPKALIPLDMTEFSSGFTSSRLVGAPPGYVGFDEGGQLTEKVRRRPYSVVLFDEFEKASPEVMNMMLQILDDGRLTDGQGRVIDFRNTIIICTANLGLDFAREGKTMGFVHEAVASQDAMREKLLAEAKRTFRPELMNRFDETLVFNKLGAEQVKVILNLELAQLRSRLSERDMTLELDDSATDFLVSKGLDEAMGARPLRRAVQQYVEDPLAESLLKEELHAGKIKASLPKGGAALAFRQTGKSK